MLTFLGVLSAFGPFVMDMYLPTLPGMAAYFNTSSTMVQLGLTTSMVGLAVGQLIFGPLSDRYGRRTPLTLSLVLFLLSTLGCLFARDIMQFVALRLLQGIAGSGGVVISRSIAADKYSGRQLGKTLAAIASINGVATVAAPLIGGMLAGVAGWHGIFWCLFLLGAALLVCSLRSDESLPEEERHDTRWKDMLYSLSDVLGNRRYVLYILQYGFTMSVLFANIASAPFIMQQHYGLSPIAFSLCFGANAVAMVAATAAAVRFSNMERALLAGSRGMMVFAGLLFCMLWWGCGFWIYEALLFCMLGMAGMTFTASSALAMDSERHNAGIASALLGAMGFVAGGFVSPLAGLGDMTLTAGTLFLAGSLCAYACTRYALRSIPAMAHVRR